jgi:hypothetical protein
MKKPFFHSALYAGLSFAALALTACDSASVEAQAPSAPAASAASDEGPARLPDAYETEILSLKAKIEDPEEREAAIRDAMIRHGFHPAAADRSEAQPQALPEAGIPAAPKSAASERVLRAKDFEFGFDFVITKRIDVPRGWTVIAYTTRTAENQNVDPRIVAFYPDGPDAGRTTTHVVGLNDDSSGLDSRISWKNTTGSTRKVTIYVFAYSASSKGVATLNYRLVTSTGAQGAVASIKGSIQATAVTDNLPPRYPCQDPADTQLGIQYVRGGGFQAGVVAVNASLMLGGYLHEGLPPIALGFVIPPGGGSFLLGVFERDGDVYEDSRYRALQDDFYPWCP